MRGNGQRGARSHAASAVRGLRAGVPFAAALALVSGCSGGDDRGSAPGNRSADQAFAPRLRVEQHPPLPGRPASLVIDVTQQDGEAALESASIAVPDGFELMTPPSGTIGEVEAALATGASDTVLAGRLARATSDHADGACSVDDAAAFTAPLAPDGQRGAAPRTSLSVVVHEAGGSTRLTICPPADGALPPKASIRRLTVRVEEGDAPPGAREALWRGVFTPAGGGQSDSTDSRAIVPVPSFLTLEATAGARVEAGSPLLLRGYLLQREPQAGRIVRILAGPRRTKLEIVGRARTARNGGYTFSMRAPRRPGPLYVSARALSVERACQGHSEAPAGCTTTTVSGISSHLLRLAVVPR